MQRSLAFALFLAAAAATPAAAQSTKPASEEMGTPEQRAACRPDVRRFCRSVKPEDGPYAYLDCLQKHREKLRPVCLRVISGGVP
jgi:hypothetical protein